MESSVNAYGAAFDKIVRGAQGEYLFTTDGGRYFDLFSSAGVANFGHNHPSIRRGLVEYLAEGGLVHGLDYYSVAKAELIDKLEAKILPPRYRGHYRYYFSPPAGTLAIEAALKYARKATGRRTTGCFTNGFHGLTYNALAATGNLAKRQSGHTDLPWVCRLPYQGYAGDIDYPALYDKLLTDDSGGYGMPAALLFETVQAEGGVNCCDGAWYEAVLALCRRHGIISIVDDIQAGCGRAGTFFSFERLSSEFPDIVCLSKSLSGFGLPAALVLVREELDVLQPGENSGTFRGNNLGVKAASLMIDLYTSAACQERSARNESLLEAFVRALPAGVRARGRGLIYGIDLGTPELAARVQDRLKDDGVLVERCGGQPRVVKIMPPITAEPENLEQALEAVATRIAEVNSCSA